MHNTKQTRTFTAAALLIICLLTKSIATTPSYFNGPYIAIGAGITQSSYKERSLSINAGSGGASQKSLNKNIHSTSSLEIAADIGYSKILKESIYLAAECSVGALPSKKSFPETSFAINTGGVQSDIKTDTTIQSSFEVLLLAKTGILIIPNTAVFAIIGTEITRIKISEDISYLQGTGKGATSGKKTSNKIGLALGFGFKRYISNQISIGLDYIYTVILSKLASPKLSANMYDNTGTLAGSFESNKKYTTHNNSLILKAGYHF